jgi:hypothetical protein
MVRRTLEAWNRRDDGKVSSPPTSSGTWPASNRSRYAERNDKWSHDIAVAKTSLWV